MKIKKRGAVFTKTEPERAIAPVFFMLNRYSVRKLKPQIEEWGHMKSFIKFTMLLSGIVLGSQAFALDIELESLSGQSGFAPLAVQSDAAASGGQFIVWPNNGANQYL